MKKFTVLILALAMAFGASVAQAAKSAAKSSGGSYFYLTAATDSDSDGDAALVLSPMFSTLAACDTAAASAANLLQGCVAQCNPTSPSTGYFLEQKEDSDKDDPTRFVYQAIGPYGFLTDCEAGIAAASSAGITDLLSACSVYSSGCKK
jgi:hypothetical protein